MVENKKRKISQNAEDFLQATAPSIISADGGENEENGEETNNSSVENSNEEGLQTRRKLFPPGEGETPIQQKGGASELTLTPEGYREQMAKLTRQITLLRRNCEVQQEKIRGMRMRMKGYKPVSGNGCPTALEILPHLEWCKEFQKGCGAEMPIVELLNSATVRIAHAGESDQAFCLSLTLQSPPILQEDDEGEDEYDSYEEVGSKRSRDREGIVYRLRVRYTKGTGVQLTEHGESNMRYIDMADLDEEYQTVLATHAAHFGIPEKALRLILLMGTHLLPQGCKEYYYNTSGVQDTVFNTCLRVAGLLK